MIHPEELHDKVVDRDSFIAFVRALAEDRSRAMEIEAQHPEAYSVDGALGWANGDIPSFLWACLEYFTDGPLKEKPSDEATWQVFADILYHGKIIE